MYYGEPETTPESTPLVPRSHRHARPPPPPPPPPRPPSGGRSRTPSSTSAAGLRKMAPGRHHQRTRSLEEWASLYGIPGISGGEGDVVHERTDVIPPRKRRARRGSKRPASSNSPFAFVSPAGSIQGRKRLSNIVEDYRDYCDQDSDTTALPQDPSEPYDGGREAFAAAVQGAMQHSSGNSRVPIDHLQEQGSSSQALSPSPRASFEDVLSQDDSTSVFSASQHHFTASSGQSDDELTGSLDFSKSPADSSHPNNKSPKSSSSSSSQLAKFEREQEIMFLQKREAMERDLSNVLERNATKSHREKQEFINAYMMELEKERATLVAQWKEEWEKREEYLRQRDPKRILLRKLVKKLGMLLNRILYFFSIAEVFVSNVPLTIAAFALSWVSMGCVWFKFMEENLPSCQHVHFFSPKCSFPEFPGCFECDTANPWYITALNWHYFCSIVSFSFCALIMLKVIIAWDVVKDELGNPTTSTPVGVFCIAMVCVFAGRGAIGELVVLITAAFHFLLAFFFLYIAVFKYRLYPDPGWFPNTVGLSYAGVKCFLYFPKFGQVLMAFCLAFFLGVFFISALRVASNRKIAAPICWFMISAPSLTLYGVTLIQQPLKEDEYAMEQNPEMKAHFKNFLRQYYLPLQHFLFACSLMGVVSAIHGVWSRWEKFKEKSFSPAHAAFVAPTLAHANALQAYKATLDALSRFPAGGAYRTAIYGYWCFCLLTGTIVNLIFTYKFLRRLPEWTKVDISGEEAPPPPQETMTHEMLDDRGVHESWRQSFLSPAVLEANEAGALIRVQRGTEDYLRYGPFIRTRKVAARGFDPTLNDAELREERAAILDWVAKNAPRKRNRTMSIPGVLHLRDKAGRDVYGTFVGQRSDDDATGVDPALAPPTNRRSSKHSRSKTTGDGYW